MLIDLEYDPAFKSMEYFYDIVDLYGCHEVAQPLRKDDRYPVVVRVKVKKIEPTSYPYFDYVYGSNFYNEDPLKHVHCGSEDWGILSGYLRRFYPDEYLSDTVKLEDDEWGSVLLTLTGAEMVDLYQYLHNSRCDFKLFLIRGGK